MAYQEKRIRDLKEVSGLSGTAQLLLVNALVFMLAHFGQWEDQHGTVHRLQDSLSLHSAYIWTQPWRWLTYMFTHAGFRHFLFNMWGLLIFGPPLEAAMGRSRMLVAYFSCGLIGGGLWYLTLLGQPGSLVGASAAVIGYLATCAIIFPYDRIRLLFPPIDMKVRTFALIMIGIDFFMFLSAHNTRIAHIAHLGGALGALFVMRKEIVRGVRHKARSKQYEAPTSLHQCASCGVTDEDAPQMWFRVCSQCSNGEEYCEAHLKSHQHREKEA